MIVSPGALGRTLRRLPPSPAAVAALVRDHEAIRAFRDLVELVFPDAATGGAIMAARRPHLDVEGARCAAFIERVEAALFPVYEVDEYSQLTAQIPLCRMGWTLEDLHEVESQRLGYQLLLALCLGRNDSWGGIALFDELSRQGRIPRAALDAVPLNGCGPDELHARLDGGVYAAAAEFADWVYGQTQTAFLDLTDEMEVYDDEWMLDGVRHLTEQWGRARAMLERIDALADALESDPSTRFAQVLAAALDPGAVAGGPASPFGRAEGEAVRTGPEDDRPADGGDDDTRRTHA